MRQPLPDRSIRIRDSDKPREVKKRERPCGSVLRLPNTQYGAEYVKFTCTNPKGHAGEHFERGRSRRLDSTTQEYRIAWVDHEKEVWRQESGKAKVVVGSE